MAAPDPTEVGRKLRQHDNELEAVYDLLRGVDGKVDTLQVNVDTLAVKVDTLQVNVDTLEAKVDAGFEQLQNGQQQILGLLHRRPQDHTTAE